MSIQEYLMQQLLVLVRLKEYLEWTKSQVEKDKIEVELKLVEKRVEHYRSIPPHRRDVELSAITVVVESWMNIE